MKEERDTKEEKKLEKKACCVNKGRSVTITWPEREGNGVDGG